jgi:hypothetical protein
VEKSVKRSNYFGWFSAIFHLGYVKLSSTKGCVVHFFGPTPLILSQYVLLHDYFSAKLVNSLFLHDGRQFVVVTAVVGQVVIVVVQLRPQRHHAGGLQWDDVRHSWKRI